MELSTSPRSSASSQPRFTQKDLGHFRVLREFREALAKAQEKVEAHPSFSHPARLLGMGDYLGLVLFGLLNPVARTIRGLSHASHFKKVQKDVCSRPVSLGSVSEAQHLVDTQVLKRVLADLLERRRGEKKKEANSNQGTARKAAEVVEWMAHDGSIFPALDRMSWALYGGGKNGNAKAVRLHLSFDVENDAPAAASVCEAKKCERGHLRENLKRGGAYVADRLYGLDYGFFKELEDMGCRFCIRIKDSAEIEIIEELALTEEDKRSGVVKQQMVRLGLGRRAGDTQSPTLRLVCVRGVSGEILVLATNLGFEELSAADVALLYKKRWEIEYYFRWIKCVMGCGHWMAESRNGVTIQTYLALIASLLLQLQLGHRPSKRVWELLQWHQSGMLEDGELDSLLAKQLAREKAQREKKPREPFWKNL